MRLRDRYELIAQMEMRDVSCRELARRARCSFQFISALRTGRESTCTPKLAARIEKALSLKPYDLFDSQTLAHPETSSVGRDAAPRVGGKTAAGRAS